MAIEIPKGPASLRGGVLATSGTFYLLCDHEDAEDDELVVVWGRRDGNRIPLTGLTDLEEIVSLIPLSGVWPGSAEAAAMTAEGTVFFLTPAAATPDPIPGAGYNRAGALDLGRMTTLVQAGDYLFAFGFGGQVYRRTPTENWQNLNVSSEASEPGYDPCFYAVVLGKNEFCFGGIDISRDETTPEMEAANNAGDADLLADLLLADVRPDRTALRIYDGRWRTLDFDYSGAVIEILPAPGRTWYVFSSTGVVWRTPDFLAFDEVVALPGRRYFFDVKARDNDVLLLLGSGLNLLEGGEIVPFDPPLPSIESAYVSISPTVGAIAAMFDGGVMFFDGSRWARLYPIFE